MKKVYRACLAILLVPLAGGAGCDEETIRYADLDHNDEAAVRAVIRERIKPEFEADCDEAAGSICRDSLGYYLAKDSFDFGDFYDGWLMPFDPPLDPRQFFVWLWEEVFGETYRGFDTDSYVEGRERFAVKPRSRS